MNIQSISTHYTLHSTDGNIRYASKSISNDQQPRALPTTTVTRNKTSVKPISHPSALSCHARVSKTTTVSHQPLKRVMQRLVSQPSGRRRCNSLDTHIWPSSSVWSSPILAVSGERRARPSRLKHGRRLSVRHAVTRPAPFRHVTPTPFRHGQKQSHRYRPAHQTSGDGDGYGDRYGDGDGYRVENGGGRAMRARRR